VGATVLADGRSVTIRRLTPEDGPALAAAMERADRSDLRKRFMGSPPPTSYLLAQLRRADGVHDLPLGAFADDGRLVGVAQFDRPDDRPSAEVAIEIAHDWQHQGLGIAMLRRLADEARSRGIHEFTATYFQDNTSILRLLRDIGDMVLVDVDGCEGAARLSLDELPARTQATT